MRHVCLLQLVIWIPVRSIEGTVHCENSFRLGSGDGGLMTWIARRQIDRSE
jgi:hypothetical protein